MIEKIIQRLQAEAEEHKKYWDEFDDEDSFGAMNATLKAISIVQEVAKEYGNGWIPVEERIPIHNGWYLVTNELGVVQQQYWGANHWHKLRDEAVVAWMELPAPYGKDTNVPSKCDTCTHNVADEVPPICYMCCKGIEDNYQKGE